MPGVRAAAKSPSVGTPLGRSPLPAFHRSERTSALGQCWKACSTATTITVVGSLPSTAKRRFRAGSTLTRARPLTRYVSFAPGTRKISATRGSSTTFLMLSIRLLPRRSGISNVRPSSSTWTKPLRDLCLAEIDLLARFIGHSGIELPHLRPDWHRYLDLRSISLVTIVLCRTDWLIRGVLPMPPGDMSSDTDSGDDLARSSSTNP